MTPTDTTVARFSLKASSVANADHVARSATEQGAAVTRMEGVPTRLTVTGPLDVLITVLDLARGRRWITADAAADAALEVLGRYAR